MTKIELPKTVETIGEGTFSGCASLKEITIPGSVKQIAAEAFKNCPELISVSFEGSAPVFEEGVFEGSGNAVIYYDPEQADPADFPSDVKVVEKEDETPTLIYTWVNGQLTLTYTGTLEESEDGINWVDSEVVSGEAIPVSTVGKKLFRAVTK